MERTVQPASDDQKAGNIRQATYMMGMEVKSSAAAWAESCASVVMVSQRWVEKVKNERWREKKKEEER
jgi:hypothetical protein